MCYIVCYKPSAAAARALSKTERTTPQHVDKPYSERRAEPPINEPTGHDNVQCGELTKIWEELQYELYNASLNGNKLIFNTMASCENRNFNVKENEKSEVCDTLEDKIEKGQQLDAIMQTYCELADLSTPYGEELRACTKSGEVKVNTTTANQDESEKLTQKIETIEEVPLVEAEPDIIKPPRTTGPTVMNTSNKTIDVFMDNGLNSDFQVSDELGFIDPKARALAQATRKLDSNIDYTKNSDFRDLFVNVVLPEIRLDEYLPLSELLQRVRLRNRLARCYEIQIQLTSAETSDLPSSPRPPMYDHRPLNPPGYMPKPHSIPVGPWPQNPRAEPLTPDNRPCPSCPRKTNVSPVNLALYLGPLISPFKKVSLFPLMTFGMKLFPAESSYREKLQDKVAVLRHFSKILNVYGTLMACNLQVNVQPSL